MLAEGSIIALIGDLGTGKTIFVKGVVQGLGGDKGEVTSPSFVLVNQYQGRFPIFHIDLYRLSDLQEIEDLGWAELAFSSGITLIEWADKIGPLLPKEYLQVNFRWLHYGERELMFIAKGEEYKKIVNSLQEKWRREK